MFYIIGNNGQEYGPVTRETLEQWIAERRLNPQTLGPFRGGLLYHLLSMNH